jgi:hypothetical protein
MPRGLEATPVGYGGMAEPKEKPKVSARADTAETIPGSVEINTENTKPKVVFDLHEESDLSSSEETDGAGDHQSHEWMSVKWMRGRKIPSREGSER